MSHGLDTEALAIAAACVVLWSVCSGRLERFFVSAPIAFVVMGLVVTHGPLTLIHFSPHSESIKSLAEVTLALVLFTDASRVNIHELRSDLGLPVRLLAIGLPLTIGLGTAAAFGIIPGVSCGWQPPSGRSWPGPMRPSGPPSWKTPGSRTGSVGCSTWKAVSTTASPPRS